MASALLPEFQLDLADRRRRARELLGQLSVKDVMVTPVTTLAPFIPLGFAIELAAETPQTDFPVLDEGKLVGFLTRRDLLRWISDASSPIKAHMDLDPLVVDGEDTLQWAYEQLVHCGKPAAVVMKAGEVVGLLQRAWADQLLSGGIASAWA